MVFAGTGVWKSKRGTPLLGCRCVFINDEQYGYNARDELTSADEVSYNYDDIGNRTTAEGKTYTANALNQYTAIDDFKPEYDADGNQTLIQTETGIWQVTYNAENRPIRWVSGDTVIEMAFDRMGRRIEMRTVKDGEEPLQRFVYDNYLCIQQLRTPSNTLYQSYIWDPTEPIATRPLVFLPTSGEKAYYFHDGNKNVSNLMDIQGGIVHYDYAPFGLPTSSASSENPFCFSSEFYDSSLGLSYYNYRHYNPSDVRWLGRDPMEENEIIGVYSFLKNEISSYDILGENRYLSSLPPKGFHVYIAVDIWKCENGEWKPSGMYQVFEYSADFQDVKILFALISGAAPGKISERVTGSVSDMLSFPSSKEQDEALIESIRRQAKNPPMYHVFSHNCIHWSLEIFFVGMEEEK